MAIDQHMFINNDSNTISVSITAYESVGVFEMLTEGDVEELVETHPLGSGSSATWDLRVPPGAIWGFGVYNGVSYTNPDPEHLMIVTGNDKNPWPPPPPPPSLFVYVSDFEDRYEGFLMALSGRRDRPAAPPAAPADDA